ncbi:MAG: methylmalonyl-CoA mutase family protein [Chloroflexota bacterium]
MTDRNRERREKFETSSGIEIKRQYTANDWPANELGEAGHFPFTRGIQPTMYRGRLWTMRQYAGYATAEESNQRYKYLLEHGQTGLSVAFDLPTQIGYDPDDPMVEGEVGKVGVSIASLRDMETLFDGIALRDVSTSMTINATAAILLALYVAVGKKQGVAPSELRGTVQNDILKEYLARGTYIYPPAPSLRLVSDIIAYCASDLPNWNGISISGYHLREAGANAVQEIAFTFANAIAYVEAVLARGLKIDDFAPQLSFFFVAQNEIFEEAAKYRAARRLWARIMRERFGAQDPKSMMLRFHTQTAGAALTAQQPINNAIRVTLQALGAVLGGTQSLHCNAFDEALALPTEESARLALRTQQIIAYESGAADTVDPLAGSYYVESLTDEIERRARAYLDKIASLGGALKAIEMGWTQNEIHESAYQMQQEIEAKERIVVGVNEFTEPERIKPHLLTISPEVELQRRREIKELREMRNGAAVTTALGDLRDAANGNDNLLPPILACVESYATVGEIAGELRKVFGEYRARA